MLNSLVLFVTVSMPCFYIIGLVVLILTYTNKIHIHSHIILVAECCYLVMTSAADIMAQTTDFLLLVRIVILIVS